MNRRKILNLLLILTSLIGYLEWGGNSHAFLFQAEGEILRKICIAPASLIHPIIILPLAGQLLLVFTLFQKQPSRILTYISLGALGVLMLLVLFVGALNLNLKTIFSAVPFLVVAVITLIHYRKK